MPAAMCSLGTHCYHAGVCCGCGMNKDTSVPSLANRLPKTQKAKGVKNLCLPYTTLVQAQGDIERAFAKTQTEGVYPGYSRRVFARPCPLTPRPGFVDSREVLNMAEVEKVWQETLAADPAGELLLMPLIDAKWNATVSPGLLTIGPGNDGATAGKASRAFPILGKLPTNYRQLADKSGINRKVSDPHIEVVYDTQGIQHVVQVRGGPKLPPGAAGTRWVPADTTVLQVISPTADLLAWETACQRAVPGTVAYCPGASLGSHSGLHCIANGIPFVADDDQAPAIGSVLPATQAIEAADIQALKRGIGAAVLAKLPISHEARPNLMAMLMGLHQAPALQGPAAWVVGYAAMTMYRYGLAAALGEWRHRPEKQTRHDITTGKIREQIYEVVVSPPKAGRWQHHERHLPYVTQGYFTQQWGSAFGGANWGRCAYSLLALEGALKNVCKLTASSSPADIAAAYGTLLSSFNTAVHQAHNGGWWMNKFGMSPNDLAAAEAGDWECLLHAAPLLYEVQKCIEKDGGRYLRAATAYGRRSRLRRKTFRAVKSKVEAVGPFNGLLRFKATWKMAGGERQTSCYFTLPLKSRVREDAEVDSREVLEDNGKFIKVEILFRGKVIHTMARYQVRKG